MALWKYLELYRVVLCHTSDDGITRKGPHCISLPKLGLVTLLLPSAFLNGFKWKELDFLKNRPLPCLASCSFSSPSQDPARRGSPSAVPSSSWWRAEEDRFFSQVLQSVDSTHSQERRTCSSPCGDGFLQGEWPVLAQKCPRQHKLRPLQGQKQERLLGSQPGGGCQAPPAPQGRRSCFPAMDGPRGAQATADTSGARSPSTQVGTAPWLDLAPQREVCSSVLAVVLIYSPDILLLPFLFFTAAPSQTLS